MASSSAICFFFVIILQAFVVLQSVKQWGNAQLFPPSKIPDNALRPQRAIVRRKIVLYHNFFRTKVKPTASNMLLMSWHEGAAKAAQNYAEQCRYLVHNTPGNVAFPHLGSCGENLFVAAQKTPWFYGIKSWFIEYQNFTYGSSNFDFHAIGHYTQMTWATSFKLGCGLAHCSGGPWGHFYNYVCYYCPAGNIEGLVQYPYKAGPPCGDCPNNCITGALCTNNCPRRDFYSNCGELAKNLSICKSGLCNATCTCGNKRLHKNYPWK